jgi:hypothetical protein
MKNILGLSAVKIFWNYHNWRIMLSWQHISKCSLQWIYWRCIKPNNGIITSDTHLLTTTSNLNIFIYFEYNHNFLVYIYICMNMSPSSERSVFTLRYSFTSRSNSTWHERRRARKGKAVGWQMVTEASLRALGSRSKGRGGPAPNSNLLPALNPGYLTAGLDWWVNAADQSWFHLPANIQRQATTEPNSVQYQMTTWPVEKFRIKHTTFNWTFHTT